jgi:hypothetical protein
MEPNVEPSVAALMEDMGVLDMEPLGPEAADPTSPPVSLPPCMFRSGGNDPPASLPPLVYRSGSNDHAYVGSHHMEPLVPEPPMALLAWEFGSNSVEVANGKSCPVRDC